MFKLNTFKLFGFPIFWQLVYLMKVIPIFWHWVYLMKVITIFWHWVYLMKVIPIFWHWVYLMKVILSVPDEGYSQCTWWRLLQSFDIECTWWRLFQKCVMCTKFDICFYFSYVKHYPPLWFLLQFSIRCFRCFYILSCRLWQNATKKFWYFILKQIHICIIHILSNNLAVLEKFTNLFNLIKFLKQYMTTVI